MSLNHYFCFHSISIDFSISFRYLWSWFKNKNYVAHRETVRSIAICVFVCMCVNFSQSVPLVCLCGYNRLRLLFHCISYTRYCNWFSHAYNVPFKHTLAHTSKQLNYYSICIGAQVHTVCMTSKLFNYSWLTIASAASTFCWLEIKIEW